MQIHDCLLYTSGTVQTPVFMNVGTQATIKGGVSALDLKTVGCQIELSNTYHLHLRPGDQVVRQMGGLHTVSYTHLSTTPETPWCSSLTITPLPCRPNGSSGWRTAM